MDKMAKAFDEAYPGDTREKPAYKTHDALVAEITTLKASFSALRVQNLVDEITNLHHQIKILNERNVDDVEKIEALSALTTGGQG